MECSEFQHELQRRLDGDGTGDGADIERHLAVCSSCRELQALSSRLIQALDGQVAPVPPGGMNDRIVSLVLREASARQQARKRWKRRLAVAASLLLAVALGYSLWQSRPRSGSSDPDALVKTEEKPTPSQARPSLNIQEAGNTLVALVNRTADETVGQGRVLLPRGVSTPDLSSSEAWQPNLEPGTQSLREAQEGVAVGFEPVTSSARRAVNLFLREIPPMETQKQ
jgi:hypothetical protein